MMEPYNFKRSLNNPNQQQPSGLRKFEILILQQNLAEIFFLYEKLS